MRRTITILLTISIAVILAGTQILCAGPINLAKTSPLSGTDTGQGKVPTVAEIEGLGFTETLAPMLVRLMNVRDAGMTVEETSVREAIVRELERYCKGTSIRIVPEWDTLESVSAAKPVIIQIVLAAKRNGDAKRVLFLSNGQIQEPPTGVETFGHEETKPYIEEVMRDPETRIKNLEDGILGDFLSFINNVKERKGIGRDNIEWLNDAARLLEQGKVKFRLVEVPSYVQGVSVPAIVIRYIDGKLRFISAYIDKNESIVYTAKEFVTRRNTENRMNEVYAVWLHELSHYLGATEEVAVARERFIIGLDGKKSRVWATAKQEVREYWQLLVSETQNVYNVEANPYLARQVVPAPVYKGYVNRRVPLANMYRRTLVDSDMLGYLYAANRPFEVRQIAALAAQIREKQREKGKPVRAVIVLGIGGESLGNRSVLQAMGIPSNIEFLYPDNIGNPGVWLDRLKTLSIKGEEVLLYVSSKSGKTDEVMSNMQIFWEWQIRSIAQERKIEPVGEKLIQKIRSLTDITRKSVVSQLELTDQETDILQTTLELMVINALLNEDSPLYRFAVNNVVPVAGAERLTQILKSISGRFTVLSEPGWFTTAMGGWDIVAVQEAIRTAVEVFKSESPLENVALRTAIYSYLAAERGKRPILVVATNDKELQEKYNIQLRPVLEWMRQLIMESLGKDGKGPYLYFVNSQEELDKVAQGQDNIVYLGLNMGEGKVVLPEDRPAISVNIQKPDIEGLAHLYLFMEEFTVRYGTLLHVNPFIQFWVDEFKGILKNTAPNKEARGRIRKEMEEAQEKQGFNLVDSNVISNVSGAQVNLVQSLLATAVAKAGNPLADQGLETTARQGAKLMYLAGLEGKQVNPFVIYSNNPEVHRLGEHIRRLGQERFAVYGGLLWDYLIGTTDQHSSAQWLGEGEDIAYTTFIHFLNEEERLEQTELTENGLVQPYLEGLTPKEISTFYLEAVSAAFTKKGRLNAIVKVSKETEETIAQLKDLFTRMDEIYKKMLEQKTAVLVSPAKGKGEIGIGEEETGRRGQGEIPEALVTAVEVSQLETPTLSSLVQQNEHTLIDAKEGEVVAGAYLDEVPVAARGIDSVVQSLLQVGVRTRSIVNPKPGSEIIGAQVKAGWNQFLVRLETLKALVKILMNKKGSFLQRLNPSVPRRDKKTGIYVFNFEDTIAELEIEGEVDGTKAEALRIKKANIMIAKVIEQIRESDKGACFVVYSNIYNSSQMKTALEHIECGGVFKPDLLVHGVLDDVRNTIKRKGWDGRVVVASSKFIKGVRSLVVPSPEEGFIPFPELVSVMQELVYSESGPLAPGLIEELVRSYRIWLELSEIDSFIIEEELKRFSGALRNSKDLVVYLPIPPTPKPGSVIDLLNQEYQTSEGNMTFA